MAYAYKWKEALGNSSKMKKNSETVIFSNISMDFIFYFPHMKLIYWDCLVQNDFTV